MSLVLKELKDRHIWAKSQKQQPALFLTKQCYSARYKVSVLSTCGGCHSEGFVVAIFYNFKYLANNHDKKSNDNDTNSKLSSRVKFL